MLRRWKRGVLWTALLVGLALLAIPATLAQATAALDNYLQRRRIMRKLVPVLALLVLAVVIGSGALATASSTATSQTMTLIAVDIPKSERYVDAGPKGNGVGDTLFFRENLLANGRKAGGTEVLCVFVSRNVGRCYGTLRLAGGTLEAAGGVHFGGRFSLPVVGGTGTHAGAGGVLTVVAVDQKRSRYVIDLAD
jgi:hypothetical protein